MNKKNLWIIVLLILITAGVVIFFLWPKTKLPEIKIADNAILSVIATEENFFKKEGLKIQREGIASAEDSMSALLAGEIDYAIFPGGSIKPVIESTLRNAPIKIIMLTGNYPRFLLTDQPELELKDVKTIGIHSWYNAQHYLALKFIEANNLEAEIIAPKTQNVLWTEKKLQNLLLRGEVDAILNSSYSALLNTQTQEFLILDSIIYMAPSSLGVRNDKIEKDPEEVQKIVHALEQTMDFIITNPEKTKKIILKSISSAKELEKAAEEDLLKVAEFFYPFLKNTFDRRDVPYNEGAELLIKLAKAGEFETVQEVEEQVVTQEELDKVFDFRFVK